MSAANFDAALSFTLIEEGGWSDDPDDPGGATNHGITLATFQEYYPDATVDDLRSITDEEVERIYRVGYWNTINGDALPSGVDLTLFDFGVNAGWRTAAEQIQRLAEVEVDGEIGPLTLAAISKKSPTALIAQLAGEQKAYYRGLADFPRYGTDWLNRTEARAKVAMTLVNAPPRVIVTSS